MCSLQVMCRWTLSVKKNYRPVKYHNWRHAITVCQTMFAILKTGKMERFMTDLEVSVKSIDLNFVFFNRKPQKPFQMI